MLDFTVLAGAFPPKHRTKHCQFPRRVSATKQSPLQRLLGRRRAYRQSRQVRQDYYLSEKLEKWRSDEWYVSQTTLASGLYSVLKRSRTASTDRRSLGRGAASR